MSAATTSGTRNLALRLWCRTVGSDAYHAQLRLTPELADLYLRRIRLVQSIRQYDGINEVAFAAPELEVPAPGQERPEIDAFLNQVTAAINAQEDGGPAWDGAALDLDAVGIAPLPADRCAANSASVARDVVVNARLVWFTLWDYMRERRYESQVVSSALLQEVASRLPDPAAAAGGPRVLRVPADGYHVEVTVHPRPTDPRRPRVFAIGSDLEERLGATRNSPAEGAAAALDAYLLALAAAGVDISQPPFGAALVEALEAFTNHD